MSQPLRYPAHYPPTDRWKRFFIGVRRLGPDLSFFPALKAQQSARSADLMDQWGGGSRQQRAEWIGSILARRLRWPTPVFLPHDQLVAVLGGPRFGMDNESDAWDAIGEIQETMGVTLPAAFWQDATNLLMVDFVDALDVAALLASSTS